MKILKKFPVSLYISLGFFLTSAMTYVFKISTFDLITVFLPAFLYVSGTCLGIKGALELKKYSNLDGLIPLSRPLSLIAVSAMLLALPSFFSVGTEMVDYNYYKSQSIHITQ